MEEEVATRSENRKLVVTGNGPPSTDSCRPALCQLRALAATLIRSYTEVLGYLAARVHTELVPRYPIPYITSLKKDDGPSPTRIKIEAKSKLKPIILFSFKFAETFTKASLNN